MSGYVGGDLEADAVLLAPGLGVRVVAAEDEAGTGEGGLLHGRLDRVVHVGLACHAQSAAAVAVDISVESCRIDFLLLV